MQYELTHKERYFIPWVLTDQEYNSLIDYLADHLSSDIWLHDLCYEKEIIVTCDTEEIDGESIGYILETLCDKWGDITFYGGQNEDNHQ